MEESNRLQRKGGHLTKSNLIMNLKSAGGWSYIYIYICVCVCVCVCVCEITYETTRI
jgi:hypothetical protein